MKYYIDPKTSGFYLDSIHKEIPEGAVEISEDVYLDLRKGQDEQKDILFDKKGKPYLSEPRSLETPVADRIADRRWQAEISGTSLDGMPVATDERSQRLILGAALEATLDPAYECRWKASGKFVTLKADQVLAVARAVRRHVQLCFDREDELLAAVKGKTFTEAMLQEGWPS